MWLVAAILNKVDTGRTFSIMTESSIGHQLYNLNAFTIERTLCRILIIEELRSQMGPEKQPDTRDSRKPHLPLGLQGPQENVMFPVS